jgi:AcrR family transcriptional regulator
VRPSSDSSRRPEGVALASNRRRWVGTGDAKVDALGDGRRNEIVDATWRLIATIGLDKTTMRRIADDVNCTTGLVTHYFASKDDVLLAALQKVMSNSTARQREARRETAGIGRLRALVLASLPLDEARLLEWRVWMAFWARAYASPRLHKEQQTYYRRWRQAVQREVKEAERVGALPGSAGAEIETTHLVGLILGLSIDAVLGAGAPDVDAIVDVVDRHLARLQR